MLCFRMNSSRMHTTCFSNRLSYPNAASPATPASPAMPVPPPCCPLATYAPLGGQADWHTLLKILPCPKLRLRAVLTDLGKKQRLGVLLERPEGELARVWRVFSWRRRNRNSCGSLQTSPHNTRHHTLKYTFYILSHKIVVKHILAIR